MSYLLEENPRRRRGRGRRRSRRNASRRRARRNPANPGNPFTRQRRSGRRRGRGRSRGRRRNPTTSGGMLAAVTKPLQAGLSVAGSYWLGGLLTQLALRFTGGRVTYDVARLMTAIGGGFLLRRVPLPILRNLATPFAAINAGLSLHNLAVYRFGLPGGDAVGQRFFGPTSPTAVPGSGTVLGDWLTRKQLAAPPELYGIGDYAAESQYA